MNLILWQITSIKYSCMVFCRCMPITVKIIIILNLFRVVFQYFLRFAISSRNVQVDFDLQQHHKLGLDVLMLIYLVFKKGI